MCIRDRVIGPDNRYRITDTTAYPNSAICYMEMKFPDDDGLYVGTAWTVSYTHLDVYKRQA